VLNVLIHNYFKPDDLRGEFAGPDDEVVAAPGGGPSGDARLLEDGTSYRLLEDGSFRLLE
jgi:hypothetical protein